MTNVDMKQIQNKLLKMAKTIAAILEKNNIEYMLAYGSLLGAVRHSGFIPWDDDFDFYLFDDSYEKAIELLRKNLPEDMFLEDEYSEPLYFHAWAHVKDLNSTTTCEEFPQDSTYAHKGLSIDLYRTKKLLLKDLESYLNDENEKYIARRKNKNLITDEEYKIRMEALKKRQQNVMLNPETSNLIVYNLVPCYKCHFMKADDIFPLKKYKFENTEFMGPNSAENILTDIYGEYMKLPAISNRKSHYSSVTVLHKKD